MLDHQADIRQHDTHQDLVGHAAAAAPAGGRRLDAIIVPASRTAPHLDHAITLARASQCRLLILCSRDASAAEVSELLDARLFAQAVVIDLPPSYTHELFRFDTSELVGDLMPTACAARRSDLSMKRNLGLVISRMLGWESIFFMDDDIRDVSPADLRRTVTLLASYHSVGMQVAHFPDNSVVCHAHRETGAFQDVLVSGSALAVDCTVPIGFFPDVYNEDWMFFYDDIATGYLGTSGVEATQLHYDPFADTKRAEWQEFGDVLAEGLYALLHQGREFTLASEDYWREFLEARTRFLDAIIDRSDAAPAQLREKMLAAVHAAQKCLVDIAPENCAKYVEAWRHDVTRWQRKLPSLNQGLTVRAALDQLSLAESATGGMVHGFDRPRREPATRVLAGPVLIPSVATLASQSPATPVLIPSGSALARPARDEAGLVPSVVPPSLEVVHAAVVAASTDAIAAGPAKVKVVATARPVAPSAQAMVDIQGPQPLQPTLAGRSIAALLGVQVIGGITLVAFHQLGAFADRMGLDAPYTSFPRLAVGSALIVCAGLTAVGGIRRRLSDRLPWRRRASNQ